MSQLVSDYFTLIDAQDSDIEITSRVRSLRGVLAGSNLEERDYRRHLEEQHS